MSLEQRGLFDDLPPPDEPGPPLAEEPDGPGDLTPRQKFEAFHEANPWVYTSIVRMARELVERGHRKIGIAMLFESLRWLRMRSTSDPTSGFKLNNNYKAWYARLVMREPGLADIFEKRRSAVEAK